MPIKLRTLFLIYQTVDIIWSARRILYCHRGKSEANVKSFFLMKLDKRLKYFNLHFKENESFGSLERKLICPSNAELVISVFQG